MSHTFIQREVLALRERGVAVETFSIRRPSTTDPRSESDHREYTKTFYVLDPKPLRLLYAHVFVLSTRPWKYVRTLFFALTVRPAGLRALVWHLFYFVEAVLVWREMRRRGIKHVHVHFAMACATVAMIATRLGDCTFSVTVHGPTVFYDSTRYFVREKVRRARMVVCISDFCRSQVMSLARPQDWSKLKVVHCAVDPRHYVPRNEEPRCCLSSIRLLNVARLSPVKGHAVLLEAIAVLRRRGYSISCTIVGDGPEELRLKSLCTQLGIQDQVRFTGNVSQDDIQGFYDEADIFVLPSFAEGLPVVLMEAMAKELPVIASHIMGIPELVEDGVSGVLVPPGRIAVLAEAISKLVQHEDLRAGMGARGRQKVCCEFDVRLAAEQLSKLFATIGSGVPGRNRSVLDCATAQVSGV